VELGRAWICSHVQVMGVETRPSMLKVQIAVSSLGVGSAVRTGHKLPASYWPGGSRGSRPARRPVNPRVNLAISRSLLSLRDPCVRSQKSTPVSCVPIDRYPMMSMAVIPIMMAMRPCQRFAGVLAGTAA